MLERLDPTNEMAPLTARGLEKQANAIFLGKIGSVSYLQCHQLLRSLTILPSRRLKRCSSTYTFLFLQLCGKGASLSADETSSRFGPFA